MIGSRPSHVIVLRDAQMCTELVDRLTVVMKEDLDDGSGGMLRIERDDSDWVVDHVKQQVLLERDEAYEEASNQIVRGYAMTWLVDSMLASRMPLTMVRYYILWDVLRE